MDRYTVHRALLRGRCPSPTGGQLTGGASAPSNGDRRGAAGRRTAGRPPTGDCAGTAQRDGPGQPSRPTSGIRARSSSTSRPVSNRSGPLRVERPGVEPPGAAPHLSQFQRAGHRAPGAVDRVRPGVELAGDPQPPHVRGDRWQVAAPAPPVHRREQLAGGLDHARRRRRAPVLRPVRHQGPVDEKRRAVGTALDPPPARRRRGPVEPVGFGLVAVEGKRPRDPVAHLRRRDAALDLPLGDLDRRETTTPPPPGGLGRVHDATRALDRSGVRRPRARATRTRQPSGQGAGRRSPSPPGPSYGTAARARRAKRGCGGPPRARSAAIAPTSGANFAPWPEQGDTSTTGPTRSSTKPSSGVVV